MLLIIFYVFNFDQIFVFPLFIFYLNGNQIFTASLYKCLDIRKIILTVINTIDFRLLFEIENCP